MEIKWVDAEDTYDLRTHVLNSKRRERPGDDEAMHLAAYDKNKLIRVSSFFPQNQDEIYETGCWRVRGMVGIQEFRRKGIGKQILEHFMQNKSDEIKEFWCNSRIDAEEFYVKLGFKSKGLIERREGFMVPRMVLRLE